MTKYTTRPLPVEAIRFQNQQLKDLPAWLSGYRDYSPLGGESGVARMPVGNLLIPTQDKSIEVYAGDWVVFDGKKIAKYKDAEFNARFQPEFVGETAEAPQPAAAPQPATPVAEQTPPASAVSGKSDALQSPPTPVEEPPAPVAETAAPVADSIESKDGTGGES